MIRGPKGEVCEPVVARHQFTVVTRLAHGFQAGRCAEDFPPRRRSNGRSS